MGGAVLETTRSRQGWSRKVMEGKGGTAYVIPGVAQRSPGIQLLEYGALLDFEFMPFRVFMPVGLSRQAA